MISEHLANLVKIGQLKKDAAALQKKKAASLPPFPRSILVIFHLSFDE